MNTNSYCARNDDTCRITLSALLAFMLSLVVGTKSLFAQPAMALIERNETSEQLFVRAVTFGDQFGIVFGWSQINFGPYWIVFVLFQMTLFSCLENANFDWPGL